MRWATVMLLGLLLGGPTGAVDDDAAASFARESLGLSSYKRASADLNGGGRAETFIYSTDQSRCGSGGCNLFVLSPRDNGFLVVLRSTITQLPVNVLDTSTNGWRELGVTVSGGGITQPYMARLQFDGRRYPSNPTVAPATPMSRPSGEVVISN